MSALTSTTVSLLLTSLPNERVTSKRHKAWSAALVTSENPASVMFPGKEGSAQAGVISRNRFAA